MSRFRHPHLLRGIVYTSLGAFQVVRGIIEAPDAVGDYFRWSRVEDHPPEAALRQSPPITATEQRRNASSQDQI